MWIQGLNGLKLMRKMIMMMMVINVKRAKMKNRTIGDKIMINKIMIETLNS